MRHRLSRRGRWRSPEHDRVADNRVRTVHFIGVGGSGMSPLAEILLRQGARVSGSDLAASPVTAHLESLGLQFYQGHAASHLGSAEVVVRSSAVPMANPEVVEAERRGTPVILRGQLLADLMAPRQGVAIAGAHGKTTTTAMVGLVRTEAGLDPTVVIGGRFAQFGSHARVGAGRVLVAEADESDRSFLLLRPQVAVVTNIDREHLESYRDFDGLVEAFARFAGSVPPTGAAVLCADDERLAALSTKVAARVVTYGTDNPAATIGARDVVAAGFGAHATIVRRDAGGTVVELGQLALQVPGRHNVVNALAAVAVALELGVPIEVAIAALGAFRGAERRFERKGEAGGVTVVDDYGHHPTEVAAVLRAARATGAGRIVCVFQPHRYTRTAGLLEAFGPALALADEIVLTDIYPAGEAPIPGVTIEALADQVGRQAPGRVHVVKALADLPREVARLVRSGDMVITLGAGSIGSVAARILEEIRG
jgi:UDP-N-acetylmuramate--alanine ligase